MKDWLEIIGAVIAVAVVAWLAYCEDVRSREVDDHDGGDCLTREDLRRIGINPDGTAAHIDCTPSPYWQNNTDLWAPAAMAMAARPEDYVINSAIPGRDQCGEPSGQEAISPHSVNGLPRGGGPEVVPAGVGSGDGATYPDRESGEAGDYAFAQSAHSAGLFYPYARNTGTGDG